LHLDIDRTDLDALKRYCGNALDHCSPEAVSPVVTGSVMELLFRGKNNKRTK
jgi:hypothetical protein